MKFKNLFLAAIACLLVASAVIYKSRPILTDNRSGNIIECSSISAVIEHVKSPGTVVVFDLDNTLIYPGIDIGSDQWFSYLIKEKQAQGGDFEKALQDALKTYYHVQQFIDQYPVENRITLDTIELLHQKNIVTLALTARSLPFVARTQEQLARAEIHFNFQHNESTINQPQLKNPIFITHGIIFCGNNPKGEALMIALMELKLTPSDIIFVDDKKQNLLDVEKTCHAYNIAFTGLRYGYLDQLVAQFNVQRAQKQLQDLLRAHEFAAA